MATINSTSTTAQIRAAFLDNCGYFEDRSVAMASRFVSAVTAMLVRGISVVQDGEHRMEFSPRDLRELASSARRYVAAHAGVAAGGAGIRHVDLRCFRE
ncbi:MAG: hypothetical protein ACE5EX_00175 [Phycisphaerae bacterium]